MWRRGAVVLVASRFAPRLTTRGAGRAPVAASLRNKLGRQAETLDTDQPRLGGNLEAVGEACTGNGGRELERLTARRHAAAAHVVAERREGERLGDLRLGHVGAAAVAAVEVAVAHQLIERGTEGQPGDAEVDGELPLRRDGLAHRDRLDQVEHAVARLLLLAHGSGTTLQPCATAVVKHKTGKWSIPLLARAAGEPLVGQI